MYQFVYWKKVVDTYDIGSRRKYARTFRAFLIQLTQFGLVFLCIELPRLSLEVIQRLSYKERMVFMVNIIKQEIVIEESLKKKLELICEFSNTTLKIINGSIRKIDRTNLTYVEPHRIIINDITFLAFNYSNEIFIENLSNRIKLSELEDYLKTN